MQVIEIRKQRRWKRSIKSKLFVKVQKPKEDDEKGNDTADDDVSLRITTQVDK